MAEINVAIIGLERLGASLGLALKRYSRSKDARHTFNVTGSDERSYNEKTAKSQGAVDGNARNPVAAAEKAQIVALAAPYYRVEEFYRTVGPALRPGVVVLDFSPLKKPSIKWAAEHLPRDPAVAAYMVGLTAVLNPQVLYDPSPEIEGAREDLFDRGTMIVTPSTDCPPEAVELAVEFARILGAEPHFMDPEEHDGLAAATEGLPVLVGAAVFRALSNAEGWGDLRRLTNPAFGLMTHALRYQHADSLWALLHYNRQNTARYLSALIETLEALRDSLNQDAEGLEVEAALVQAAEKYTEWEGQRFANIWEKSDQPASISMAGAFTSMTGMLFGRRPPKDDKPDQS